MVTGASTMTVSSAADFDDSKTSCDSDKRTDRTREDRVGRMMGNYVGRSASMRSGGEHYDHLAQEVLDKPLTYIVRHCSDLLELHLD